MKFLFGFLLLSAGVQSQPIKSTRVLSYMAFVDSVGRSSVFDSVYIEMYQSGNKTVYGLPYHYSESVDDSVIVQEVRYHYFLHIKDSIFGYDFDEYKNINGQKDIADSILKDYKVTPVELNNLFNTADYKLFQSIINTDSGTLHEAYEFASKTDTTGAVTLFIDYVKRAPLIVNTGKLKDLESERNMTISNILLKTRLTCLPVGVDIRWAIEPLNEIKPIVSRLFEEGLVTK
ncbi:hypothetical protein GWC95_02955 [Sediminibacterium roseum]|uniref:Uncharacterized protein n=1 Tax=Sediminibacterium roseum TaxID=1978412 RepID=A0ABW9ZP43_9BACT|nr:hypothetical protein [Sediminibacterium roseum]NCI48865.1 hypothetical protein [Sediminibacterium roseum]